MECLYIENLDSSAEKIIIAGDEFSHLKALHVREGEQILASNGQGLLATLVVEVLDKRKASAVVLNFYEVPYPSERLGLALGILDNRERFEFALEKAVELGATDFYPVSGDFSQKHTVKIERLEMKAIAAMKQSKQAWKINIHTPVTVDELFNIITRKHTCLPKTCDNHLTTIYYADMNSTNKLQANNGNAILLIGAEGGFSDREEAIIAKSEHVSFSLGNNRLRAETASLAGLSIIKYIKSGFGI
ncbi:MAG: RsmE family RNA methyltransferase [Candidatus Kapabacteria bacterium]|nr:RsmE family RNA methyltransferase [Candidatus Kapabacteria bacterium]